ncbi:unnamed protein product [Durusdinium trenchii]|uniref:Uncharacterized protein n=1 Tax=Durusdinium trenchii TaxID=1381693 RepID=A0ABP0JMV1_9DINO
MKVDELVAAWRTRLQRCADAPCGNALLEVRTALRLHSASTLTKASLPDAASIFQTAWVNPSFWPGFMVHRCKCDKLPLYRAPTCVLSSWSP